MKPRLITFFVLISCAIFLFSCSNTEGVLEEEKAFSEMYKDCEMNEKLRLSYVGRLFDGDKNININLEPTSNVSVMFPASFNLRLMTFDDKKGSWIEIKDNVTYLPADAKYIVGINDPINEFANTFIGVNPALDKKTSMRAVVYGNVYQNGVDTNQCTGAFIDFEFTP